MTKIRIISFLLPILGVFFCGLFLSFDVSAQCNSGNLIQCTEDIFQSESGDDPIPAWIDRIINFATFVGVAVAIIYVIVGGYQIMSGRDEKNGLGTVRNAVIGLIVIIFARLIVSLITTFVDSAQGGFQI